MIKRSNLQRNVNTHTPGVMTRDVSGELNTKSFKQYLGKSAIADSKSIID